MLKKILIVEDEFSLLEALKKRFSQSNFTVLTAADGVAGLAIAKKEHPDLILLDLVMPKMDGMTMLKLLRQDAWGKQAPVVILSNLSDAERVSESAQSGVYDYLVKTDWHIDDVVDKVREKLGMK